MRLTLPRAVSVVLLSGCSGPAPLPDGGATDAGDGTCHTAGQPCDPGTGSNTGYCVTFSAADGGEPELRCIVV